MKQISEVDRQKMRQYGISETSKTLYWYNNYCYEKLQDAINYAQLDAIRGVKQPEPPTMSSAK
ncbi:hypothetical protein P2G88_01875 [Aliiglaciecola sp. CAU 1673]|uniref:hypothetical protein n=1 Tax=Aliiglaciecola sp. CAU 1673 TaxID=3032595 RepID=UPI0023DA76C0|nr:hypothetical protein [Aliiglaciecola sp. CAU 1673]MDF2177001.1 hypothetical protein [Aliiglaciecola sp. CAU 1673]